jgi:murein DD-endopeptidase MepM/ murein hydrolase activator NlpD
MRRRSHLAVLVVALLAVGWNVATTQPRGSALAADPQAELARTQERLADAQSTQRQLQRTLERQREELAALERRSTDLSSQLDLARAELKEITAEYQRVSGLLAQVRQQVDEITARLAELNAQIAELDEQLTAVAAEIRTRVAELRQREALLEDHLRAAYERSQASFLEVLLAADSIDAVATEVGHLFTVSDADAALAEEIRNIRSELETRRATLRDGRRALADARAAAEDEEARLQERQAELTELETRTAELKVAAEEKEVEQEALLNAALEAKGDVEARVAANERAAAAQAELANKLQRQAAAQQAAIEEARRREEEERRRRAEEEARQRAADDAARRRAAEDAARNRTSPQGFRWPERSFRVTQEWGPTNFVLEPPYTYKGTYYPHFHGGIDIANGCGTPIYAAGPGVVAASGQPLMPWDTGFGVVINHGNGIMTWYWHLQPQVVVAPGQAVTSESVVGYEGTTGNSTGCHLHFSVNDNGIWENPRWYLP